MSPAAPKPQEEATGPVPTASVSGAPAEESASVAEAPAPEFAPESVGQLVGAWTTSPADCGKLFQRRGKALVYRQPVDLFAQAAIVEPLRIRLPTAVCQIDRASNEGGALRVSGDCQDTISYTSRTVYIKARSGDMVSYSPTGDPVLATALVKCPL